MSLKILITTILYEVTLLPSSDNLIFGSSVLDKRDLELHIMSSN